MITKANMISLKQKQPKSCESMSVRNMKTLLMCIQDANRSLEAQLDDRMDEVAELWQALHLSQTLTLVIARGHTAERQVAELKQQVERLQAESMQKGL